MAVKLIEGNPPKADVPPQAEWAKVFKQAAAGNKRALAQVRAILDKHPGTLSTCLSRNARTAMLEWMSARREFTQEIMAREAQALYDELAGANPSPLETLLVERIITSWLEVSWLEANLANRMGRGEDLEVTLLWERQTSIAQRRHLAAIKALAQVRKLQLPLQLQFVPPAPPAQQPAAERAESAPQAPEILPAATDILPPAGTLDEFTEALGARETTEADEHDQGQGQPHHGRPRGSLRAASGAPRGRVLRGR